MQRPVPIRLPLVLGMVGLIVLLARSTVAGPPLICHSIEIGDAQSLAWGKSAFDPVRGYAADHVVRDTLALLDGKTTTLVRMETMRRAAMYLQDHDRQRDALRTTLMARVLDADAGGRPSALAWFDAGYFTQTVAQLSAHDPHFTSAKTSGDIAGYRWVAHALTLRPDDAEMEFAAAMMTALADTPEHAGHVTRARRLAGSNTLLTRNLEHHGQRVWPRYRGR